MTRRSSAVSLPEPCIHGQASALARTTPEAVCAELRAPAPSGSVPFAIRLAKKLSEG